MVNMRAHSLTPEDIGGSSDANAMAEMCAAIDELCRHNKTLENNVLNIWQRQQETKPLEDMEVMDPHPL